MVKGHTPLLQAKLQQGPLLCAKLLDNIRFSSIYSMLEKPVSISKYVKKIGDMDFKELLLSTATKCQINNFLDNLKDFDKVVLWLQRKECSLWFASAYFDLALDVYSSLKASLHANVIYCITIILSLKVLRCKLNVRMI